MTEPSLSEDDIEWVKNRRQEEEAMSRIARRLRITALWFAGGLAGTAAFWDHFKAIVRAALP